LRAYLALAQGGTDAVLHLAVAYSHLLEHLRERQPRIPELFSLVVLFLTRPSADAPLLPPSVELVRQDFDTQIRAARAPC